MLDEHGFGDHGTRTARTGKSGDCHQQVQEQDDQIAHGTIMPPREIQENAPELAIRHAQDVWARIERELNAI